MNKRVLFLFIVVLVGNNFVKAQCAMCKAAVKANMEAGGTQGAWP